MVEHFEALEWILKLRSGPPWFPDKPKPSKPGFDYAVDGRADVRGRGTHDEALAGQERYWKFNRYTETRGKRAGGQRVRQDGGKKEEGDDGS